LHRKVLASTAVFIGSAAAQMVLALVTIVPVPAIAKRDIAMKASIDTSTLSNEFHNIIKDLESMLKDASALGGDEYAHIRQALLERIAAAKAEMTRLGMNLADKVQESKAEVSADIREEPWKAVGTAAVAGLLLGFLFARR
jgi:ElaB/YqjD/DUF883 family membrane-anchored ribosome-binding protein